MARHARPIPGGLEHPALQSARRLQGAPTPGPRPSATVGWLRRARAVAMMILAAVVLGAVAGLLLTDGSPSAAYMPRLAGSTDPVPSAATSVAAPAETTGTVRPDDWPDPPESAVAVPTTGEIASGAPAGEPSAQEGESWATVLGRLDDVRSAAFGLGDPALLATVYVEGSGPLERDVAALTDLAAADVRAVGLRLVVDEVSLVQAAEGEVVLRVVDRMPGYELVRGDGSVVEVRGGRGAATWLVTLRGAAGSWQIASVSTA